MVVKDIYSNKVYRCSPGDSLESVIRQMMELHTNTLVVCQPDGTFAGMVSSRDLLMAAIPPFIDPSTAPFIDQSMFARALKESKDLPVSKFMISKIPKLSLDTPVIRVAAAVLTQNESRLPVIDESGKVIGVVTRTQIKDAVARVLGFKK